MFKEENTGKTGGSKRNTSKTMDMYINEEVAIAIATKALREKKKSEFGFLYKDFEGNQYQLTRYWSECLDKELSILEKLPRKQILELMTLVFLTSEIERIAAICNEIGDREFDHSKKNRLLFIEELERDYLRSTANSYRVKLCIGETRLFDPTNRDTIVGKTFQEINEDAKFYRTISDRAKKLVDLIDSNCN